MTTVSHPNRCPRCAADGDFTFRELADRPTWQPVSFDADGEPSDYESFDYGDEVSVTGYDCRECGHEWPTLDALRSEQNKAERLEDRYGADLRDILCEPTPVYLSILYTYGEPGERAPRARNLRRDKSRQAHGARFVAQMLRGRRAGAEA